MLQKERKLTQFLCSLTLRVVVAIIIGTLLLTLVYMIPTDEMEVHLQSTAQWLSQEESSPTLFSWCSSALDNYTDSLMLVHAVYRSDEAAIVQAMKNCREYAVYWDYPQWDMFNHYVLGEEYVGEFSYARYWHGYLVWLKPLFSIINYRSIQILNGILQTILLFAIIYQLYKKQMKQYILPYLIAYAFLMPVTLAMSLQYSACYYILSFGCLALLLNKERLDRYDSIIFLYIGIAVAYFDLLTYPVATLGVPAVLYLCMKNREKIWKCITDLIRVSFCWGFGYGAMWAGKWVIGSLITGENMFADALNSVQTRTTHEHMEIYGEVIENPAWTAFITNWEVFWKTPATLVLLLFAVVSLVLILVVVLKRRGSCKVFASTLPFIIAACMPVAWYMVTANHSIVHAWFTHKAMVVLAFSVMCMFTKIREEIKNG